MSVALIVCAAGWLAGWLLFARFRRCVLAGADRNLSVIIPARDEAENLPRLLHSVAADEVIVVDDCSRDRTSEVAREFGARVVTGTPPPSDWRGKTWACQQGADAATGELLLFVDADTWFECDANKRIDLRDDAMSIAPYHVVPTWREQFSAFFQLVMLAATGPRNLLGQSLLIARDSYENVGGHAAVKDDLIENLALGRKLRAVTTRLGRGVLHMRMYPRSWRELIDGWSKGFANGAAETSSAQLALIFVWIAGCVLAVHHIVSYAAFAFQIAVLLRRVGSYRALTALLYPLPLLFFFAVFARSAIRTRTRESILWKGRPVRVV